MEQGWLAGGWKEVCGILRSFRYVPSLPFMGTRYAPSPGTERPHLFPRGFEDGAGHSLEPSDTPLTA